MARVHAEAISRPQPLVRCSQRSLAYAVGYAVNLILMPFKAYLSEPLPWTLAPEVPKYQDGSFEAFSNASFASFDWTYNNRTLPDEETVIHRDESANTYLLREVLTLPAHGSDRCVDYMSNFPAAIHYSRGVSAFVCAFVAANTSTRLQMAFCTWLVPRSDGTSYHAYHGVQLLESRLLSWMKFGCRCGLSIFNGKWIWRDFYRHYGPLFHNLRTIGLGNVIHHTYVVDLGDPTWLILSHPFVSLVMVVDCFVNVGYSGAAGNRTSQFNNLWEFCIGCLYGSRTVRQKA
ncbi:Aste57867_19747 [Aphanomyces stellatus]|uniref:Aste57867_19747 protein n=1 Tax=Aphanomyces stellatus TaxID=120398 RepID=A0A485LF52_9STRA|nr:hypothetical protein As57867_019682 [Aphanomyces stellatus]VFT96445.1 Aste57867_19747 [Aphanomyces stellatus]